MYNFGELSPNRTDDVVIFRLSYSKNLDSNQDIGTRNGYNCFITNRSGSNNNNYEKLQSIRLIFDGIEIILNKYNSSNSEYRSESNLENIFENRVGETVDISLEFIY